MDRGREGGLTDDMGLLSRCGQVHKNLRRRCHIFWIWRQYMQECTVVWERKICVSFTFMY